MKHTEICIINKDKLYELINKVIGLYQIVDDHCMVVDASLSHCERPRKGDMRTLNDSLEGEFFDTLESIGCPHYAMAEDDEDAMFEGILNMLEPEFITTGEAEDNAETAQTDLSSFLEQLGGIFLSGKPVTISANIYINTESED